MNGTLKAFGMGSAAASGGTAWAFEASGQGLYLYLSVITALFAIGAWLDGIAK